jgi:hypothetical protein
MKEWTIPASHRAASRSRRRVPGAAMIIGTTLAAITFGGCGLGPGAVPTQVTLTITRDFGSASLQRRTFTEVPETETVMSLLRRNAQIATGPLGRSVQSIDGQAGNPPNRWFLYVNGVRVSQSPTRVEVHPGDHIWWDVHDPADAADAPAVIGSFPEPFLNGLGGQRLPVRVQCVNVQSSPCQTVTARLRTLGVPAAIAGIGVTEGLDTLRVLIGAWNALQSDPGVHIIRSGPQSSGVYARFSADGRTLTLFNEGVQPVRTLEGDVGLIAAARFSNERPEWVITGTDQRGVELAAGAFDRSALRQHFALVVTSATRISIPIRSG